MNARRRALLGALATLPLSPLAAQGARRKRLVLIHFEPTSEWKPFADRFVAAL